MNDAITTATAERVVDRLLNEYDTADEYTRRPGGPRDPYRQTTVKLGLKPRDFTGKRPASVPLHSEDPELEEDPTLEEPDEEEGHIPPSRLRFGEAKAPIAKSPGTVNRKKATGSGPRGKAIKGGHSASTKGAIAKKPGTVSYRKEDVEPVRECNCKGKGHAPWCKERDQKKDGEDEGHEPMGESKARKLLNAIAKKPGKISYGKK